MAHEPITVFYIFYTELSGAGSGGSGDAHVQLRTVHTERAYWTDTMRAIEQKHGSVRAAGGKQSRQCLEGRVVGHVRLLGSRRDDVVGPILGAADAAALRAVDASVPRLVCGSILQQGDVLIVRRVPDSVFWAHDREARMAWRRCKGQYGSDRESAEQVAARHSVHSDHAALVRPIEWWVRHASGSDQTALGSTWTGSAEPVQFAAGMSEQARIALVTGAVAGGGDDATSYRRGPRGNDGADGSSATRRRSRFPPADYVCERCGVDGHWVSDCPTQDDARYDQRRLSCAKGIPRRFLRTAAEASSTGLVLHATTSSSARNQVFERVHHHHQPSQSS